MNVEGRTVLLTGASSGIGPVVARTLAARGATLLLSGRRADALESLRDELGGGTEIAVADLAEREEVTRLGERAGEVDIFVSNAGLPGSGQLGEYSVEEIDRALDVNLRAPIQLARAIAPRMIERRQGHLVFVSSLLGKMTRPGVSLYCATKFGLRGFALALGDDLHPAGIGVSSVLPGFVKDVGMLAETGVKPPRGLGLSAPHAVADAIVRAVEREEAELVVAPRALRAGALLLSTAPRRTAKVRRRAESYEYAEAVARAQSTKR